MNNKPTAWISELDLQILENDLECVVRVYRDKPNKKDWQPLYTHPAKTLTDAEIKKARVEALQEYYNNNHDYEFELSLIDELFARAILRKAQEK